MKNLLLFPLLFISSISLAQYDTLFFDIDWKVCSKSNASFYRIAEVQEGGGYLIKDTYIKTNIPQMVGFTTTIEPTNMYGKCTYYYPSGKKESEGYYYNDAKTGMWINWSKSGKDSTFKNYGLVKKKVAFEPQELTKAQKIQDSIFRRNAIATSAWDSSIVDLLAEKEGFSFALRGKVASFFIIEDVYFLTYSIGTEFSFNKHSLGVDYTWFRWRYEEDNSDDVGMYSQYELRTYFLADYKYTFWEFPKHEFDLYVNVYDKIGDYKMWYNKYAEYDFGNRDMTFLESKSKGTFNEPGLGIGVRKYAEQTGFGVDCSMNVGLRMMNNDEETYLSATETDFKENVKSERTLFYMRLNCFYVFGR